MGIAGDPWFGSGWEPKMTEQEEPVRRWMEEAQEAVRAREAIGKSKVQDKRTDSG